MTRTRKTRQPFTIEHVLLGLVRQQPMHGYEIYQRLKSHDILGEIWHIKQSQLYALLTKLEQAGHLATTVETQSAYPPRKVLHLTESGADTFATWIQSPITDWDNVQREFLARLYFAQLAGDDVALHLVTQQQAVCADWLDELNTHIAGLKPCQSSAWLALQLRHSQMHAFLDWLDRCTLHFTSPLVVLHTIAPLATSQVPGLASAFVAHVCSLTGQALLEQHGFFPAGEHAGTRSGLTPAHEALQKPTTRFSPDQSLTVFAAAVLKDVLHTMARTFSDTHGGMTVDLIVAGSQYLADELVQGADADVFASADRAQMQPVIAAGRVAAGSERVFARNRLVVVTPKQHTTSITTLRDLAQPGLKIAFGSPSTAIGHCTLDVLDKAQQAGTLEPTEHAAVLNNVAFYEHDVRAVLNRVASGEADAGMVYSTDYQRIESQADVAIVNPFLV